MEGGGQAALGALQAELGEVATGSAAARVLARGLADFAGTEAPQSLLDALLTAVDRALSAQLDAIYAEPRLRELEARWRGAWLLVQRVDKSENTKVELLNCSKEDLWADFEDAPETPKSGLYKLVYSAEYGPFGGRPYALLHFDYTLEDADARLVEKIASVAAMTALVVTLDAGPERRSPRWGALRRSADARHVALIQGRFAARERHPSAELGEDAFRYHEASAAPLLTSGGLVLAMTLARSFALWRSPVHVAGPAVGRVWDLPRWEGRAGEVPVTREAVALAEERGEVLVGELADGEVMVANARNFWLEAPGQNESYEAWAATQLPHTLFAARIVHYVKVLQREQIGTWKERADLERELQAWLDEHSGPSDPVPAGDGEDPLVAALLRDPTDASALAVYADWLEQHGRDFEAALARRGAVTREAAPRQAPRKPLASASIRVDEVEGNAGWYRATLRVTPAWGPGHGAIELVNKLDRE